MGRQPWTSRLTVEKCTIFLCATRLRQLGFFRSSLENRGTLEWQHVCGDLVGTLRYRMIYDRDSNVVALFFPRQMFNFDPPHEGLGQTIHFTSTQPNWGGVRYWFECECGRRSGRLYLPPGETFFRRRPCYDLTFQSSQEHSKKWDQLRPFAEWYAAEVKRTLEERAIRRQRSC